jgi:tRNA 2-(methylsulfanyl)-N6-isopentenyladenosine37 hydroxylase
MLNLHSPSPERWLAQVAANVEELLLDHAHCEKKAAGTAMNLLFAYVEHDELTQALSEIVQEELSHFHLVRALLARRHIRLRRIRPSRYAEQLRALASKLEPQRAVDRLLLAGLIEARSCERFGLLRDHLDDVELSAFFGSLFESEARHHSTYIRLAHLFASEDEVRRRLAELAEAEARIIALGDDVPRMHS